MEYIDISWPLDNTTTTYKNKKNISLEPTKIFKNDAVRETTITINSHTGTHVDAPAHFLENGKTIDQIELKNMNGKCTVLDMTHIKTHITHKDLQLQENTITPNTIILLKTTNSAHTPIEQFNFNFVYLDASGAEFLQEKNIKAVGIDYLGIERNQPKHSTHTILMHANIPIIEGLRLQHVTPGPYFLICLPLNIIGLDASPARAVIIKEENK